MRERWHEAPGLTAGLLVCQVPWSRAWRKPRRVAGRCLRGRRASAGQEISRPACGGAPARPRQGGAHLHPAQRLTLSSGRLASWPAWLALAGTGDAQHDDDDHDEEYGDCRRGYRPGPVEAWGRGRRGERDFQAHPRQDLLGEFAIVVVGGGVAEGVCDSSRSARSRSASQTRRSPAGWSLVAVFMIDPPSAELGGTTQTVMRGGR